MFWGPSTLIVGRAALVWLASESKGRGDERICQLDEEDVDTDIYQDIWDVRDALMVDSIFILFI